MPRFLLDIKKSTISKTFGRPVPEARPNSPFSGTKITGDCTRLFFWVFAAVKRWFTHHNKNGEYEKTIFPPAGCVHPRQEQHHAPFQRAALPLKFTTAFFLSFPDSPDKCLSRTRRVQSPQYWAPDFSSLCYTDMYLIHNGSGPLSNFFIFFKLKIFENFENFKKILKKFKICFLIKKKKKVDRVSFFNVMCH